MPKLDDDKRARQTACSATPVGQNAGSSDIDWASLLAYELSPWVSADTTYDDLPEFARVGPTLGSFLEFPTFFEYMHGVRSVDGTLCPPASEPRFDATGGADMDEYPG